MICMDKEAITQVFEFAYTDCFYESAMTISLHKTKKGAYKAMREFLINGYMEWYNERLIYGKRSFLYQGEDKFGEDCAWAVRTIELKE